MVVQYARPGGEQTTWKTGHSLEREPPIEAAQIMNVTCVARKLPGFNCDLLSWGDLPSGMQAEGTGTKWAVKPAAASFQHRWQLALVCQTTLVLWLDEGTSTPQSNKSPPPPCKASPTRTGFSKHPEAIDALVWPFSVLQIFAKQKKFRSRPRLSSKKHELLLAKIGSN
jgi:hypothetical protein